MLKKKKKKKSQNFKVFLMHWIVKITAIIGKNSVKSKKSREIGEKNQKALFPWRNLQSPTKVNYREIEDI